MAKSNGRTQRPQRTSRNSSKADVETKAAQNDDVEAVEDLKTDKAEGPNDEHLDGDLLDLDDSSDTSDVVAEEADADIAEDKAGEGSTAVAADADEISTAKKTSTNKAADADDESDEAAAVTEKAEKSEKSDKEATSGKDSKSSKKAESAKGASAKSSSAKRTSRSGNPAKRPQGRKTATYTSQSGQQTIKPNPRWFLPVLIGLLLIGLIWLVTFYVSQGAFPVEAWGNWNILIGFAFFVAGLIMSTRWR